tara:strand:+ start:116 stop:1090 length:975 start_codon:yes stop_codon:yes gene_type:complete
MQTNLRVVRVEEVFVKANHSRWIELGQWDSIGMVSYSELNQPTPLPNQIKSLKVAKPINYNFSQTPTVNELIYIVNAPSPTYLTNSIIDAYYFPPIGIHNSPNHNASPITLIDKSNKLTNEEVEGGGVNKSQNGDYYINFGENFKEVDKIRPLAIEEGDVSVEGRYGNSIKFGSNSEFTNPNIIFRNGQRELNNEDYKNIKEDINNDNSSIYMYEGDPLEINVASLNDASYLTDIYEILKEEEPTIINEDMPENIKDDIVMSTPTNIPAPELQDLDLQNLPLKDRVTYDISETEQEVTVKDGSIPLVFNDNYDLSGININQELG